MSLGEVRNYQGGRVANNRGRVTIFCALKKGEFFMPQASIKFFYTEVSLKLLCLFFYKI